jgi:hypothetical protein
MELVHNNVVTENRKGLFCRQNVKIQDATLFLRRPGKCWLALLSTY